MFVATAVLSREIENKTVLTVVSKPIGRTTVIFGKYIGVAAGGRPIKRILNNTYLTLLAAAERCYGLDAAKALCHLHETGEVVAREVWDSRPRRKIVS